MSSVVPHLTQDHLRELGLPLGARIKLLAAIARLAKETEKRRRIFGRTPVLTAVALYRRFSSHSTTTPSAVAYKTVRLGRSTAAPGGAGR